MTSFEQTLLHEVSTLPESRRLDVLAFIRFLKITLPDTEKIRRDFKAAMTDAHETAKNLNLTPEDIDAEIRAVRDGQP
jgi:hypothetical protein